MQPAADATSSRCNKQQRDATSSNEMHQAATLQAFTRSMRAAPDEAQRVPVWIAFKTGTIHTRARAHTPARTATAQCGLLATGSAPTLSRAVDSAAAPGTPLAFGPIRRGTRRECVQAAAAAAKGAEVVPEERVRIDDDELDTSAKTLLLDKDTLLQVIPPPPPSHLAPFPLAPPPSPSHTGGGTGLTPPTSSPGLGSPHPHPCRDWAHSNHILAATGPAHAHNSAKTLLLGTGRPLHFSRQRAMW
jgi:hypothetical protein